MAKSKGALIVFEGIDGSGKSTQARMLAEALRAAGHDVVELREPTDGPHGREIRRLAASKRADPKRERELFVADRREDVEHNIRPALERGAIVILDRYYYSTMAYQGARGVDPEEIRAENESFAPKPDLLLIFHLPVDAALERVRKGRDGLTDEFEKADYLTEVQSQFERIRDSCAVRIDATKDMNSTANEIRSILSERMQIPLGAND